jgi:hypothetical protein
MGGRMVKIASYCLVALLVLVILGAGTTLAARRTVLIEQINNTGCG